MFFFRANFWISIVENLGPGYFNEGRGFINKKMQKMIIQNSFLLKRFQEKELAMASRSSILLFRVHIFFININVVL